nr:hypothetical protein [uncultured Draconibacterium sp.]
MTKTLISILLLVLFFGASCQTSVITKKQWIEDLEYLVKNLKQHHPNLYYRVSENDFALAVEKAKVEISNTQTDLEAFYALKKLIAKIQDGHTQLWDNGYLGIEKVRFPIRLDKFTDGVFITVIEKEYQKYIGARLLRINGIPIDDVLRMTVEATNMDNEFGRIRPSVQDITFARTLVGLGIIDDEDEMKLLVEKNNKQEEFIINSVADTSPVLWSNRIEMAPAIGKFINVSTILEDKTPLHLKRQDKNFLFYWFKYLKNENAIYFQYNQVWATQPNGKETWLGFIERLWDYIDENDVKKLIIDVRYNDGGNGRTIIPFINEIIKRDQFCKGKNLFVLVGNRTYSAAVIFLTELAVHTDAIFIGSPPACPFNFFSDMVQYGNLPNSGANLGIASRQIDNAWSNQTVHFIPDVPAPFSSDDYFSGKDPAISAALNPEVFIDIASYAANNGAESAYELYKRKIEKYNNLNWWIDSYKNGLELEINSYAYQLMGNSEMRKAFQVFKLNTMINPKSYNSWDSYAEWFLNTGDYSNAIKYYTKSIELNPQNHNGLKIIDRIRNLQKH